MNEMLKLLRRLKAIAGLQSDYFVKFCTMNAIYNMHCYSSQTVRIYISGGHFYNVAYVANLVASAATPPHVITQRSLLVSHEKYSRAFYVIMTSVSTNQHAHNCSCNTLKGLCEFEFHILMLRPSTAQGGQSQRVASNS